MRISLQHIQFINDVSNVLHLSSGYNSGFLSLIEKHVLIHHT